VRIRLRWTSQKAVLAYPIPPAPRTAVLQPWFRSNGLVRVFDSGVWDQPGFEPAAIAATWPQFETLMGTRIPELTHALIVLARPGDELLTAAQREELWSAFRVPVFQQIVNGRGVLLAAECEAHDGLHIEFGQVVAIGATLDRSRCGCGRTAPRLKFVKEPAPMPEWASAVAR
jgi:hypothetical protein